MSISIKRATGVMGGTSKIDVLVNDKKVNKLKNNEEIVISTETEDSKIRVKKWFFGSQDTVVKPNSKIEVKINQTALYLYIGALLLVFAGLASQLILFSFAGLIACIAVMVYSNKNWFKLEINE
ncbi:hypothetical protein [Carnobacterium maltaromaticum]|uniref:hypothetical protein n=1 Tax=Carnobacterium maltaromaticum TaxID=2751 RepID=UPI0005532EB1|nr:hypothetical protein [Carnobacterium maltaromaticum]KRN68567.1 hypothetical protein IV70_GL001150 [Carnobacterium maltaromaticum DSM 20342]